MNSSKFTDIKIENYSERCVVIRGDTRNYVKDLKKLGGKYNGKLKDGPGWIFPKNKESELKTFVNAGKHLAVSDSEDDPDTKSYISYLQPSLTEYGIMATKIGELSSKIEYIEKAVTLLLNKEQLEKLGVVVLRKKKVVKKEIVVETPKVVDDDIRIESESDSESDDEDSRPLKRLF